MLEIRNISKTFAPGTVNEKKAICGLSLNVEDGDFITIIGSNGAGKSTLFNAIAGTFFVDDGFIFLGGQDITYLEEHKRSRVIGRMFQDPLKGTAPSMTIEENLALAYLRSSEGTSPFSRISARDKKNFRQQLSGCEELLSDPVYVKLDAMLQDSGTRIAESCQLYDLAVDNYDELVSAFPANVIIRILELEPKGRLGD